MQRSLLFLILFFPLSVFSRSYTISGYITDSQSGEPILSASVLDLKSGHGAISNSYGFYSLTLAQDSVNLHYSYVGYDPVNESFILDSDTVLHINLSANNVLQEVNVSAARSNYGAASSQMSTISVPIAQIQSAPAFMGETDVIKTLQLLPGVQGGVEGSAGMYVRGGGPEENLLLLDGVPVYNINHALGFFSVFDPDAIKAVTLYKGSFPARFGGRLSSVVDIRMNDGDMNGYHGNFSIGLISSKFHVEGPLWKGHTAFSISGRRTYYDLLAQPILALWARSSVGLNNLFAGYYFWDVNAKLTHCFSNGDKLFASFYMGDDVMYANIKSNSTQNDDYKIDDKLKTRWKWGNIVAALRWNHIITPKLFLNTSVNYTQYRYNMTLGSEYVFADKSLKRSLSAEVGYNSGINDVTAKIELDYSPTPNHNLRFGGNYTYHIYRPGVNSYLQRSNTSANQTEENVIDTTYGDVPYYAHETALYAEDDMTLGRYVKANVGLHYSTMTIDGRFYHSLQPRVSMRVMMYKDLSFKVGYAYMTQYIHLLSNNNVSLPSDLWVPITSEIKPMNVHQVSAGVFYDLKDMVCFSVEGYYKSMSNLLEYKDGATFLGSTTAWDQKVCQGRGWSYGVEVLMQRTIGKTTGWIGYTWSRTIRQFDREGEMLNQGKPFPAKYDRIHDVSITINHKFTDWFDLSATWVFSIGTCGTLAMQLYPDIEGGKYSTLGYIHNRNNYRYDNYHRLDLGANFHYDGRRVKRINHTWSISVYNAYNSKNPFMMFRSENEKGEYVMQKITLFPISPTVTYSFKF